MNTKIADSIPTIWSLYRRLVLIVMWCCRKWLPISAALITPSILLLVAPHLVRWRLSTQEQTDIEAIRAAGRPVSFADLHPDVSPLALDRQIAWRAWSERFMQRGNVPQHGFDNMVFTTYGWRGTIYPTSQQRQKVLAVLVRVEAMVAEARELLAQDQPLIGQFVFFGKWWKSPTQEATTPGGFPTGLSQLGQWLHYHALLATESPASLEADLRDLDHLHRATAHPTSTGEWYMVMMLKQSRDRAYLELALVDRLPATSRDRWLAEESQTIGMLADCLRYERLSMVAPETNDLSGPWPWKEEYWQEEPQLCSAWLRGLSSYPACIDAVEAHLRNGRSEPVLTEGQRKTLQSPLGFMMIEQYLMEALMADARQRMARIVVRILDLAHGGRDLPALHRNLVQLLGDHELSGTGPYQLRLRYTRIGTVQFRIDVDPTTPPMDVLPEPDLLAKREARDFVRKMSIADLMAPVGVHPSLHPLEWIEPLGVEVILPAVFNHGPDDI